MQKFSIIKHIHTMQKFSIIKHIHTMQKFSINAIFFVLNVQYHTDNKINLTLRGSVQY